MQYEYDSMIPCWMSGSINSTLICQCKKPQTMNRTRIPSLCWKNVSPVTPKASAMQGVYMCGCACVYVGRAIFGKYNLPHAYTSHSCYKHSLILENIQHNAWSSVIAPNALIIFSIAFLLSRKKNTTEFYFKRHIMDEKYKTVLFFLHSLL